MDCKFTLHCNKCGCNTELAAESWISTGRFECPSCRAVFPRDIYPALSSAIETIALLQADTENFSISVTYPWDKERRS